MPRSLARLRTAEEVAALALSLHLVHMLDEALSGMHDDPVIAVAYAFLAPLGARHAAYLVFQATFALGAVAVVMVARGGVLRRMVFLAYGLALVGETHHLLRALLSGAPNAGLATSLPLPLAGAWLVARSLSLRYWQAFGGSSPGASPDRFPQS